MSVRHWLQRGLKALAMLALAFMAPLPAHAASRIVAVGDLHGDFAAWRAIAQAARLIDAKGRWIGGDTVLVQTGDVPDRGPDTLKIVRDLMRLQREAQAGGGRVVALVGNHEAMMLTGDLRYVSPGEYAAFADRDSNRRRDQVYKANKARIEAHYRGSDKLLEDEEIRQKWLAATPRGMLEHQAAWHPDGFIGRWVIGNPAVALIDGTLFVHAGISAAYVGRSLDAINNAVAAALAARETLPESIINDPFGPLWYRGLARSASGGGIADPEDKPAAAKDTAAVSQEDALAGVLQAMGARRMVIAHTPNPSGILLLYGDRLARIDTGISAAYGGSLSYLEIIGDRLIPHAVARPSAAERSPK